MAAPLSEPDVGGEPDSDGGPPVGAPEPPPMFGQFLVEPDPVPEFELDPDPELDDELEDPEPVEPAPVELEPVEPEPVEAEPVVPVFELDEGVEVGDVVAALATSAPPATRPDVSAPAART